METDRAFAERMMAQVQHIERYRQEVLRAEGRILDGDSAAWEWISRYAALFPSIDSYLGH